MPQTHSLDTDFRQYSSLNNIGSVFRTADAFLIEKIYLCGITATPPHKDIQKTALGATASVEWEYVEEAKSLVALLREEGVEVWAIEQTEGLPCLRSFNQILVTRRRLF